MKKKSDFIDQKRKLQATNSVQSGLLCNKM